MPNHVQQLLKVEGENAFARLDAYFTDFDETGEFNGKREQWRAIDFNKLIPMPEILRGSTASSHEDLLPILLQSVGCAQAWEHQRHFDKNGILGPWPGLAGIRSGEIEAKLEQLRPGAIAEARALARRYGETGFKSWYDWSIVHWDTKWNAYSCGDLKGAGDSASVVFSTAWSPPEKVLAELVKREPDLFFEYVAFNEHSEAYYHGHGRDGVFSLTEERYPIADTPEMRADFLAVYGEEFTPEDEAAA